MPKSNNQNNEDLDLDSGSEFRYFKSQISGLAVRLSVSDDRGEVGTDKVRFVPYEIFDKKLGEHYLVGLLQTDEPEVVEVLEEDSNVVEIDEDEYNKLVEDGKRVPY